MTAKYRIKKEWNSHIGSIYWTVYLIDDEGCHYIGISSFISAKDCEQKLRGNISNINMKPEVVKELEL